MRPPFGNPLNMNGVMRVESTLTRPMFLEEEILAKSLRPFGCPVQLNDVINQS